MLFPFHNKGPIIHFRSWTHRGYPYLCHLVIKATTTHSQWVSQKFELEEKAAAYSLSAVSQGKLITAVPKSVLASDQFSGRIKVLLLTYKAVNALGTNYLKAHSSLLAAT